MKQTKLSNNCYFITQSIKNEGGIRLVKSTNHIVVIDCSGSMSYELQAIRTQLKNRLASLLNEKDTLSLIWFSGNGESGILFEGVEIKSLITFQEINNSIDKWLRPIGMTAFVRPLELVKEVVNRISLIKSDSTFSMLFMTDGMNNSVPWNDVIKATKELENLLDASCFCEYGFYSNGLKLNELASILGGEKISCSDFDEWSPLLENKLSKTYTSGKKKQIYLGGSILYDFVFSTKSDGSVLLYNVNGGSVTIGEDVNDIYYFSDIDMKYENTLNETALYAAAYILSDKLMNDQAENVIGVLGDKFYQKMLSEAFGKQKLNAFKTSIKECVTDTSKRFLNGKGSLVIDSNAYCLMNLIDDLGSMENCLFFPGHESWNYKRIGRQRVAVGSKLTDSDKEKLTEATNAEEMLKFAQKLADTKIDLLFTNTNPNRGYPLNSLVWNEERANLSVLVKIDGIAKLPKNKFGIDEIATYKYNTYTIIKDGILNVTKLPVNFSAEITLLLFHKGVKFELSELDENGNQYVIIDLSSIPIINRSMVKNISANELAKQEWNLLKVQATDKVYKYYRNALFPKESKGFAEMLGQETADWLKEIGITDYNGFNPKVETVESTDFYMSVNLITKVKGMSSLPKVDDVIAKMKDAKAVLKPAEFLMANVIKEFALQLESTIYKALPTDQQEEVLRTYLISKTDELNKLRRSALKQIAMIKFSLILSKRWFLEFKTFDENKLNINLDGFSLDFTFELTEKQVKI